MGNALQWFRQGQRGVARVLLAAFCAAWLQFAILPCTTAHAATPVAGHDYAEDHAAVAGGGGAAAPCHGTVVDNDCLYCLGDGPAESCDYPHEARVDLRDAGTSFAPLVLATFSAAVPVLSTAGSTAADRRHARGPADTSSSLQTLYCRRLR
jgi:hypothetical protein